MSLQQICGCRTPVAGHDQEGNVDLYEIKEIGSLREAEEPSNFMSDLKGTLAQLDDELLAELMEAAQFALNDMRTAKRVAAELDVPLARIQSLALIAIQLSVEPDAMPAVSTMAQLDAFQAEVVKASINPTWDQHLGIGDQQQC